MTDFEKRLISLMSLGVIIQFQDGHRWIESYETEYYDFAAELEKNGINLNNKIYGGIYQCLDIIDECLQKMHGWNLLDRYNDFLKDVDGGDYYMEPHSRIDIVEKGNGGLY